MSEGCHIPIRTCLVCGKKASKQALLRLALDPADSTIVLDSTQSLEGRGAYVCQACLPALQYSKRMQRAFRNRARGLATDNRR